jgi:transcriptional regulator with XRE-family HTH domain
MSTAIDISDEGESLGFPELTSLGKQIEVLRIGRGLSKQHLARYAGTSRQQLWRVMSGKSELTNALRARLAEALRVPESMLAGAAEPTTTSATTSTTATILTIDSQASAALSSKPLTAEAYLAQVDRIEQTLRTLPNGSEGRELKRTLLNAVEDISLKKEISLPPDFFDLRRRVLAGEL